MPESINEEANRPIDHIFSGNIFIFYAFDIGEDTDLAKIKLNRPLITSPITPPKFFKNYHIPLEVELPHPHSSSRYTSCKIHSFGALSLTYKIPFNDTLDNLRAELDSIYNKFKEQSVIDAGSVFKRIKPFISKPDFFHLRSSYLVIQIDPIPDMISISQLKKQYGGSIASALRFETEILSEYQKNPILDAAMGYYRGELLIIDTEAAFVYDAEYQESLDFFEFANIQQLELRYFDRLLDQLLNNIYEGRALKIPFTAYLPFIGSRPSGPVAELGRLKVDISVITERLESSIKLAGEPYFAQLYSLLSERMGLDSWKESISKKLEIVKDIRLVYQHQTEAVRDDFLNISIVILISVEVIIAFFHLWK